jgi:hypothetical protein
MPKNKQLQFLEDAEKLYVEDGIETITIEGILKSAVSRRTLDNWKEQYNWDKKRVNHKQKRGNLQDKVIEALDMTVNLFFADPSDKNFKKIKTGIEIAQKLGIDLGIKDKGEAQKKAAPKDIADKIKQILKVK